LKGIFSIQVLRSAMAAMAVATAHGQADLTQRARLIDAISKDNHKELNNDNDRR
jgi:hypothetical protein